MLAPPRRDETGMCLPRPRSRSLHRGVGSFSSGVAVRLAWFLRDLSFLVCFSFYSLLQAADIKVLGSLSRDDLRKLCGDSFPEWISFPQFEQVSSTSFHYRNVHTPCLQFSHSGVVFHFYRLVFRASLLDSQVVDFRKLIVAVQRLLPILSL